jgi:flavin reductase (DIM6/NTAB) family NADH-FMN oxidoreductase RutF
MSHDEKLFRNVLGRFATGVCVVAARGVDGAPIGMTINSFASASLSPSLVQWSLRRNCLSYGLFSQLPAFTISVLSAQQLEISRRYAKAGDHVMLTEDYGLFPSGTPYIHGAIAHFECKPWQVYEAGDHDIIVAAVDRFVIGTPAEPLVFYEGGYRSLIAV